MNDNASSIAIVGMSGRFPGAGDIAEYWQNLRDGVCSIMDITEDELRAAGVTEAESSAIGYIPAKGYLAEADRFEAELFGFNRSEAAILDPQHRLLLEVAWTALEDAGYDPRRVPLRAGVYVGGSLTEHMIAAQANPSLAAEIGAMQLRTLTDREFLAPWVSYRLGLSGPSVTVQTACSTSLTAVHLAVQALLCGECDLALAGGVSVDSVRKQGYTYLQGGIFSPDGRCRPFDERSAGTVGGNGVGVVVMRRLADAIADGDPVRAVIRGTAATNDGSAKVGFTAPSVTRQTAAIVEAWSAAGLEPAMAQYLEMHGTATSLGDQIEVAAVKAAFDTGPGEPRARCALGSVKSNIGHLDAAAGVAGLIKVVLMLEHATIVPTVNTTRPNPALGLEDGPFRLATCAAEWELGAAGPRLAGVTGVGIGGSNVHVVLEEAPPVPASQSAPSGALEALPLSARTESQLAIAARKLATALSTQGDLVLAHVAYTLQEGRAQLPARGYVLAATKPEAVRALEALAEGRPVPVAAESPAVLQSLAEDWLLGKEVAWTRASDAARRVHLPTYSFAGSRYGALRLAGRPIIEAMPGADGNREAVVSVGTVADLFCATLGLTSTDELNRSFFTAGGDSLAAIHLIGRLRDDFDLEVPVEAFFDDVSLAELATRITAGQGEGSDDGFLESLLDENPDAGQSPVAMTTGLGYRQ